MEVNGFGQVKTNIHCCGIGPRRASCALRKLPRKSVTPRTSPRGCGALTLRSTKLVEYSLGRPTWPQLVKLLPIAACVDPVVIAPGYDTVYNEEDSDASNATLDVEPKREKSEKLWQAVLYVLRFIVPILVVAALVAGSLLLPPKSTTSEGNFSPASVTQSSVMINRQAAVEAQAAVQRAHPSVVSVENVLAFRSRETMDLRKAVRGSSTGVIWDSEGHVVTQYHAIKGASEIRINLSDGSQKKAQLVGFDAFNDIAVLRLDCTREELKFLRPMDKSSLERLETPTAVLSVENPRGRAMMVTNGMLADDPARPTEAKWKPYRSSFYSEMGYSNGVLMDSSGKLVGFHDPMESGMIIDVEQLKGIVERSSR